MNRGNFPSPPCPYCQSVYRQARAGRNRSGTDRWRCGDCQRHYTPKPRPAGYPEDIRQQALEAHRAGVAMRKIARLLSVNHQSVVNWVRQGAPAPEAPEPPQVKPRATIEDVAREARVAASTVSNYLNDKGRMSPATRERIRAAINTLHFTPNALVRAIRARRTRILGVLIFDLERMDEPGRHALTIPLLAGIYAAAEQHGYDVLLYTGWPQRPERHSGMDFLNGHVDGLLWAVPGIETPALERVAAAGLPVVAIFSRHVPANVGYINGENIAAAQALVAHLAEQGHQRIAFAGPARRSSNYEDRREGYRRGLTLAGLPYDPVLEPPLPDNRQPRPSCERLLRSWLALPEPPTAVMAVNDEWAAALLAVAQELGLQLPQQLAVTGFDDVPAASSLGGGLTTVHQPFRLIGAQATERLLALIGGASVESCRVELSLELVVRRSSVPSLKPV